MKGKSLSHVQLLAQLPDMSDFRDHLAPVKLLDDYSHVRDSRGESNDTPLQYSCLENPMNGGAWWAAVHGVAKSRTRLSDFTFTFHFPSPMQESEVAQSCLTRRDPMGCSLPGSSIHGIFQARVLEWGAIAFSTMEYYSATKNRV